MLREEDGAQTPERIDVLEDGRLVIAPKADYGSVVALNLNVDPFGRIQPEAAIYPVDETVAEDPAFKELQEHYRKQTAAALAKTVGFSAERMSKADIARAAAEQFRQFYGTDFGWASGVRLDAMDPGIVTRRETLGAFPFGNRVLALEASGRQIIQSLQNVYAGEASDRPVSDMGLAGMRVVLTKAGQGAPAVSVIMENGQEIDPNRRYTLSTTNYIRDSEEYGQFLQQARVLVDKHVTDAELFERAFSPSASP